MIETVKDWRPTSETPMGYAMFHKPTRRERFWKLLGFRQYIGDEPDNPPQNGWIHHTVRFQFCWRDRLRLLLTGKFKMTFILYTDAPSPLNIKARTDWYILPPGSERWQK